MTMLRKNISIIEIDYQHNEIEISDLLEVYKCLNENLTLVTIKLTIVA